MKRAGPFVVFIVLLIALVLLRGTHWLEAFALVIVLASIALLGRSIFRFTSGGRAVVRVLGILALTALAYGEIYFLLPSGSFDPAFARDVFGLADALHFSIVSMLTFSCDTHSVETWAARGVQLSQLVISVMMISFGLNYVLEQQDDRKG